MKSAKNILILFLIIGLLGSLGFIYFKNIYIPKKHVVESSTIVLEKIDQVLKLVTLEGEYSDLSSHEEYYGYNISPFRKKTLVRVVAKVLVGYDLEKMELILDETERTVYLDNFPEPEILSLDDDVEYYDISEGLFVSFSKEDYTAIQKKAKKDIEEIAINSGLLEKAKEHEEDLINMLGLTLNGIGWNLVIDKEKKQVLD